MGRHQRKIPLFFGLAAAAAGKAAAQLYDFNQCKRDVELIIKGNITVNGVSNETISQYLYHGPVPGILEDFPRSQYLAVTYEGCLKICGNYVAINDAPKALNMAATWVFPLAIMLSLPYDSLHRRKIRGTLEAVSNWLGSPQTALTSTIFNFRQMRDCHRRVKEDNLARASSDAYFVLSCLNQFDLHANDAKQRHMLQLLVYGLFRPLETSPDVDALVLRELLATIALQLRMLRRRGVIPTMSSLATYLVSFVFSIVLAFEDLGDDTTAHGLALGLLFSWLPLLVVFTIVDRNPVSPERCADLISRWLHNVSAVRAWKLSGNPDPDKIAWWMPVNSGLEPVQVGRFIGQGRRMQYCGLVDAVLAATEHYTFDQQVASYDECADAAYDRLQGWRPLSWHVISHVSAGLVICQIMMALLIAFNTPTVGLGCRSLSYALLAILTSATWVIFQAFRSPPRWARVVSHLFNTATIALEVVIVGLQLTGGMNNCYCKASLFNIPVIGGYVDFYNAQFYKEHFHMKLYWATATIIGGTVDIGAFLVAVFWWLKCQHLWSANERTRVAMSGTYVDMTWLR